MESLTDGADTVPAVQPIHWSGQTPLAVAEGDAVLTGDGDGY